MKSMKNPLIPQISRWLVMLCLVHGVDDTANAAALNVAISPAGDETFLEDTTLSGQVTWFTEDDLTIPNANTYVNFKIIFEFMEPDNIPVNPSVSELSLLGWPAEFGETAPWTFEWMSGSIGGPLDTWLWSATLIFAPTDNSPAFLAGQDIATANWSTGGDDIDDIADYSSFRMTSTVSIVLVTPPDSLFWDYASDAKLLNPEPIPEPVVLTLISLGSLAILRRRRSLIEEARK